MKKLFSLSVFLAAILLLIGCEKEKPPVDKEFTPDHWPTVKTLGATPLTSSTAKLTGAVNAYGLSTTVTFEYGTTTSYGSSLTANQSPVTGDDTKYVSADISGLILDTTYHFRVKAENSLWKNFYGRDMVFTIQSPKVETLNVTNITETTAILNGTVNTYGLSTPITFEYGTTTSYGSTVTAHENHVTGNSIINVSADISGLTTCTTYHFRIKAENSCGIVYGSDKTFICPGIQTWTTYTTADGLVSNDIRVIAIDAQSNKWFGTTGGVSKFDGTVWTTYTAVDGLVSNNVRAIAIDAHGNKWFGTAGGISKFDGTNWINYTTSNGLINNNVRAIALDAQGNKWFGTYEGVSKFDGANWTNYTTVNGLVSNNVSAIAIDAQGNKWFGTEYGGVSKFDGTNWTNYTQENSGLLSNSVYAIAIDTKGNKWFGTEQGISKFDGTNWTTYTTANGLPYDYISSIAIDAQGNKWFGCPNDNWKYPFCYEGVSEFDDINWTTYTTTNGLPYYYISSIAIDAQGNKWFGSDEGVSRLSNGCN